jgi:hypothetical protein
MEFDELQLLRPTVAFLRRKIDEEYKYPQFAILLNHGVDTYGNFKDPLHMRIVSAIICHYILGTFQRGGL